ncbi:hypothetical protein BDN72DRAFT_103161 [Pluteus cervinus]|uniref:Uncharacterized protein n=1 Tax=Pluteus cervinus TaxID=181527 RepID=A0ACD3B839_9AGAR|nr:hypothetical protein BDN72DRAFT_103161 [Pluteus cervinus]
MATPSSSATSPSPPMAFMQHTPVMSQASILSSTPAREREQRKKAVEKFLARAELSMVTRGLRARLSYASYKAARNIPHASLHDLEAQTQYQNQAASFSRTIAAKRKATGANTQYTYPLTPGPTGTSAGASTLRRTPTGVMAPPSTFSSPQAGYPFVNGPVNATNSIHDSPSARNSANAGQSLYSSILAPPPNKHARTIHNPNDPPVPASTRPAVSPRVRAAKPSKRAAESTRAQTKGRHTDKAPVHTGSPGKRKRAKRPSLEKGKHKERPPVVDVDADGDVDMKAAATLTSLLLHHRPSIPGSVPSPRSSVDGSDNGSTYSYSHFAQSSARTTSKPSYRNQTPSPGSNAPKQSTPRPAPTDNEAADLMLYLATSPSPVRPASKDARDLAAFRTLTNGPASTRPKGRVLFQEASSQEDHNSSSGSPKSSTTLTRGGDGSFNSSISSIGGEMGSKPSDAPLSRSQTMLPTPSQLLPPAPMPASASAPGSPKVARDVNQSPKPLQSQGSVEFNFHDFIHASPSPSRALGQGHRTSLGLRADIGRKLFEEEQLRHAMSLQNQPKRPEERPLASGVDLVHT